MKFSEENRDDYKLGSREITFAKFVSRVFLCGEFPRPNRRLQPKIRKEILKNTLMTNQKISNLGSSRPQSLSSFYCGRVGQRLKISVIDWSCVFYSFLFQVQALGRLGLWIINWKYLDLVSFDSQEIIFSVAACETKDILLPDTNQGYICN